MALGLGLGLSKFGGGGFVGGFPPEFIIEVDTTLAGSASDTIQLPIQGTSMDIDWGDGNTQTTTQAATPASGNWVTHTYAVGGVYEIKISNIDAIRFANTGDKLKLKKVTNWGNSTWTSFDAAFWGCSNATEIGGGTVDTSSVGDMTRTFASCSSLTSLDVSGFDTSSVTSMSQMFQLCASLTSLDVSGFNTSSVTNMGIMFQLCASLTSLDVSGFNTSSVTSMFNMFNSCSSLTTLDVTGFDTSSVTSMSQMFQSCSAPDINPSGFDITSVTNLTNFMAGSGMTTANYDNTLINWEAQIVTSGLSVNFGSSTYTAGGAAETARTSLIDDDLWSITDGGAA